MKSLRNKLHHTDSVTTNISQDGGDADPDPLGDAENAGHATIDNIVLQPGLADVTTCPQKENRKTSISTIDNEQINKKEKEEVIVEVDASKTEILLGKKKQLRTDKRKWTKRREIENTKRRGVCEQGRGIEEIEEGAGIDNYSFTNEGVKNEDANSIEKEIDKPNGCIGKITVQGKTQQVEKDINCENGDLNTKQFSSAVT